MTGGDLEMRRKKRRREEIKMKRAIAEGVNRGEERIQSEGGRGGRKHCEHRESNGNHLKINQ